MKQCLAWLIVTTAAHFAAVLLNAATSKRLFLLIGLSAITKYASLFCWAWLGVSLCGIVLGWVSANL